jgi:redox-sensing transcriptional repressor
MQGQSRPPPAPRAAGRGETVAHLKRLVLERLMRYYRLLDDWTSRKSVRTVTSAQIAKALHVHATQVRKDFAAVGLSGTGRVGFDVRKVRRAIRATLGLTRKHEAVLIGTGHLGGVLLTYSGFARYGLHIMAAFDDHRHASNGALIDHAVRPMKAMKPFIRRHKIRLTILAPPTEISEKLIEGLVSAGVKAIWNFTPAHMTGPAGILVRNERHFSVGLSEISYYLKR